VKCLTYWEERLELRQKMKSHRMHRDRVLGDKEGTIVTVQYMERTRRIKGDKRHWAQEKQ
jgi:hypothetical protein